VRLRRERIVHLPAALAAAGAALLLVQWAAARPLWLDEELIAINLRDRGIRDYLEPLWLGQAAPFGWLALERVVVVALGAGERALRLLPVLFGIATLATASWIGRRWMTPIGATILVVLCAGSQWLTFYFVELKPYSADAFFALLLPAVAAWSIDDAGLKPCATTEDVAQGFSPAIFWLPATIGQWFANGALFVTPSCAVVLAVALARRDGWRAALRFTRLGLVWLVSFALNYWFVLRHAQASAYLQQFWAFAFPPLSDGASRTLQWLAWQLAEFGVKPGGTRFGMLLWLASAAGFFFSCRFAAGAMTRRSVALLFAMVPLSAMMLAALRLVPFYERLALWVVPALYVGVAFLADAVLPKPKGRPAAVIGLAVACLICGDVVIRGVPDALARARARHENRGHDDRAAVRWLASHAQPGDVWVTTRYGAPAIWWYGGIHDRRVIEVAYRPERLACRPDNLAAAIADAPRVLLYLGFRFDDAPRGFDDLIVGRLSELGSVIAYRSFAVEGDALVIDRRIPAHAPTTLSRLDPIKGNSSPIDGCLTPSIAEISTFVR